MAKELLEFKLNDGSTVLFETVRREPDQPQRAGRVEDGIRKATQTLEAVVARIRPAAEAVLSTLREMNTPTEIELEFGVAFTASADVVFASADSEVNFTVRLKWENAHGRHS